MINFPAWYFDESRMAGVDFEDDNQVTAFDRKQQSSTPEKEQALVDRLKITAGHTVIDLGAGTGTFAIEAALSGATVHAVDISRAMLNYAQVKAQQANVQSIKFHRAGFLTYEQADSLADFVISKSALHILPDFWKAIALQRIAAMLKPQGIFYLRDVIFSFAPAQYESEIRHWIDRATTATGWAAADYEMHLREEHSTFAWIIEGMLTRSGLEIVEASYLSPTVAEYLCIKSI